MDFPFSGGVMGYRSGDSAERRVLLGGMESEGHVTGDLLALGGCSRTWGGMGVGNNGSLWLAQQREERFSPNP